MHIIAQTACITIREFLTEEENTYLNHFNDSEVALYRPKEAGKSVQIFSEPHWKNTAPVK